MSLFPQWFRRRHARFSGWAVLFGRGRPAVAPPGQPVDHRGARQKAVRPVRLQARNEIRLSGLQRDLMLLDDDDIEGDQDRQDAAEVLIRVHLQEINHLLPDYLDNPGAEGPLAELAQLARRVQWAASATQRTQLADLAGAFESAMDRLREKRIHHSAELVEMLLAVLEAMFDGQEGDPDSYSSRLAAELRQFVDASLEPDSAVVPPAQPLATREAIELDRTRRQELPPELLRVFLDEVETQLESMTRRLQQMQEEGASHDAIAQLRRQAHSIKGAAGAIQFRVLADLAHRLEDCLEAVDPQGPIDEDMTPLLLQTGRTMRDLTEGVASSETLAVRVAELLERISGHTPQPVDAASLPQPQPVPGGGADQADSHSEHDLPPRDPWMVGIRPADKDSRGEAQGCDNSLTARISWPELEAIMRKADALAAERELWRGLLDDLAFAIEHGVASSESAASNSVAKPPESELDGPAGLRSVLRQLRRLSEGRIAATHALRRQVLSLGVASLDEIAPAMHHIVSTLAGEQKKLVDLVIEGGELRFDRGLLPGLGDALLHLLRNAVDHGVETPERRRELNKPERATIRISLTTRPGAVLLKVRDDGGGLNVQRIRDKAREWAAPGELELLTRKQLLQLVLRPGFSTAERVDGVSGRGVGMHVVADLADQRGGRLSIDSADGLGAEFSLELPVQRVDCEFLLVCAAGECLALPGRSLAPSANPSSSAELGQQALAATPMAAGAIQITPTGPVPVSAGADPVSEVVQLLIQGRPVALVVDEVLGTRVALLTSGPTSQEPPGNLGDALLADRDEAVRAIDPDRYFAAVVPEERPLGACGA